MASDTSIPDPNVLLDLLVGFRRSKTMFAAVELGIFDRLSTGSKTLAELAESLEASPDGLERLLDACVGLSLLTTADSRYENTPGATAYLTSNSPRRLTGYIRYSNDVMWKLWSHLEDAVLEGSNRWDQAYGWDGPIFSNFFRTDEAMQEFLIGMHGFGLISSPSVVSAFDLEKFRRLADLGGATGHLAIAACERHPGLEAVVFDLPGVAPLAQKIVGQSAVADRVSVVSGDFFEDPLPDADIYALGRILHDWSEPKVLQLLGRIHDALPSGGAVLIAEKLLNDDRSGPDWAQMQNLNMLTCTEGKERTLPEYESLLARSGFVSVQGHRTTAPLDAVIAFKP